MARLRGRDRWRPRSPGRRRDRRRWCRVAALAPKTGEKYQPAGLRCLGIALLDPASDRSAGFSGQCGEFPRTPGFSRVQHTVWNGAGGAREVLVFGRAPEDADGVIVSREGELPIEARLFEGPATEPGDFYLIALSPQEASGHVHWIDGNGSEGSRGIELAPP